MVRRLVTKLLVDGGWRGFDCIAPWRLEGYIGGVSTIPAIYTPSHVGRRVEPVIRIMAGAVAIGCMSLLILAAWLRPDASGTGTHEQLHLVQCQFLEHTGIPCISCGMTTSFSWYIRGNFLASFYLQPMGFVLAVLTTMGVWIGLYIAISGRSIMSLMRRLPTKTLFGSLIVFALLAWAWKIYLHLHGIDGWA